MGRSQDSFSKREREKKKAKKREEKLKKKEERKASEGPKNWDDMIAYVDEFGNITDTPPDPAEREEVDAEDIVLGIPKKEKKALDDRRLGKVNFFNTDKGFGFIKESDTQNEYFVHISNVQDEIRENDKVSFELEQGDRGMVAVKVSLEN